MGGNCSVDWIHGDLMYGADGLQRSQLYRKVVVDGLYSYTILLFPRNAFAEGCWRGVGVVSG